MDVTVQKKNEGVERRIEHVSMFDYIAEDDQLLINFEGVWFRATRIK